MTTRTCAFRFDYPDQHTGLGPGCQFIGETDFFECDGQYFCRFHLPLDAKNGEKTAKGRWQENEIQDFQAKIDRIVDRGTKPNQTVNLTGVVFPADAIFNGRTFGELICYRTQFTKRAEFANTTFDNAYFSNARFQDLVFFSEAKFQNRANFRDAQFQGFAYFLSAQFQAAVFRDVKFQAAFFSIVEFKTAADFRSTKFQDYADFRSTKFQDYADFSNAWFQVNAEFNNVEFQNHAYFMDAKFQSPAEFIDTKFQGHAYFSNAQFQTAVFDVKFQTIDFTDAEHQADAKLNDAQSHYHVDFHNAQFQGDAFFIDAEFQDDINFMDAKFQGNADFSHTKRTRTANQSETADNTGQLQVPSTSNSGTRGNTFQKFDFSGGNIDGIAVFNNRIFNKPADFSRRHFVKAPHFHGCELHQGTNWFGTRFDEREGPNVEMAYRTLRLAMEKIRDRLQEAIFFSHEQETMRKNLPWWKPEQLVSWAYQVTSDYGRSIVRPAVSWFLTLAVFPPIYWLIYWYLTGKPMNSCMFEALGEFTILQTMKPFGVLGKIHVDITALFPVPGDIPLGLQLFTKVHSALSLTFIGLLILALRWRFKRG